MALPITDWTEADIPAAWRNPPVGAVLKDQFTPEESEQVELDRR